MNVSFTPAGDFFVFDESGKTLQRGFRTKAEAWAWIAAGAKKPIPREAWNMSREVRSHLATLYG